MGKTITVTTVTITTHYDNDPSCGAEVHVGMTKEDAEAKAINSIRASVLDYFDDDAFYESVFASESFTSIGALILWVNDQLPDTWFEQSVQTHEVAI